MNARAKAIIESCPYEYDLGCEWFKPGAEFTPPEMIDMVLDGSLPNGTYWLCDGVRYVWYNGTRYELTTDEDIDESTAARVVSDATVGYHAAWVGI